MVSLGLLLLALAAVTPAESSVPLERARSVLDDHLVATWGHDALLAYENRTGPARVVFTVMRRWEGARAQVMIDVREPTEFREWALLLTANRERSDDLFAFFPTMKRVRRLPAETLQQWDFFKLFSISDFRPWSPEDLEIEHARERRLFGRACVAITARTLGPGRHADRVELTIDPESGAALETVYFREGRELRRIQVRPEHVREFAGRRLPAVQRASGFGESTVTEIRLRNAATDVDLPAQLFTHHNLSVQRFPSF